MIFRHESAGMFWIDVEHPSPGEIRTIAREFSIGERIETELLSPTPLPLVASDNEHVLLVLHVPSHAGEDQYFKNQEVDFVVGKNFILTVRYEVVAPFHRLRKILETTGMVGDTPELGTDVLLEILFAHLFSSIRDHANHVSGRLERIEHQVREGNEREAVLRISETSREFLHLSSVTRNNEEPLSRFLDALHRRHFFGVGFVERAQRLRAEHEQLSRLIDTHRAIATELRETNDALLSAKQNDVMKKLTVIIFLILPAELTIFIFDMALPGAPLAGNPNAFWIVIGVIVAVVGCLSLFVAHKRWF